MNNKTIRRILNLLDDSRAELAVQRGERRSVGYLTFNIHLGKWIVDDELFTVPEVLAFDFSEGFLVIHLGK